MTIGKRDTLIELQKAAVTKDGYGGEVKAWSKFTAAWTEVLFGTGQERRQAAQETASQAATFIAEWTPKLAQVVPHDRLIAFGAEWDITSAIPVGRNRDIHFTAVMEVR